MPLIDLRQARAEIPLSDVLALLGFVPRTRCGAQWRGPCPLHGSQSPASRSFAAHVGKHVWHCFRCGQGGNALDLWARVTGQELYAAVLDLYQRLGRSVPWLQPAAQKDKNTMKDP
jgi:DNA primase